MKFSVRRFTSGDREIYQYFNIRPPLNSPNYPEVLLVDSTGEIFLFPFGGKGHAPATTGEPPDYYAYVTEGEVVYVGLRLKGSKWGAFERSEQYTYVTEEIWGNEKLLTGFEEALLVYKNWMKVESGSKVTVSRVVIQKPQQP